MSGYNVDYELAAEQLKLSWYCFTISAEITPAHRTCFTSA